MFMLILSVVTLLTVFLILTYPTRGNVNRLALFIKNVGLLCVLYVNICLTYAILSPLLQVNFSSVLNSINSFFNSFIVSPFTQVFGTSFDKIFDAITFLPNYVGDYFYRELSVNESTLSLQVLIISVSIAILSIIDITTKLLLVDKHSHDINHKFLSLSNYTLTIITGIAVLLSAFVILPYYYELSEVIVINPGENIF